MARAPFALIALIALGCGGATEPAPGNATGPLWPLEAGAVWHYRTPWGELEVKARLPLAGEPSSSVVLVTRGAGLEHTVWLADVPPLVLAVEEQDGATQEQFAPFQVVGLSGELPVGSGIDANYQRLSGGVSEAVHEQWRVVALRSSVRVAAGTFSQVLELERQGPEGTVRSLWARGVGELFEDGPGARELVSFSPAPEIGAAPVDPAHAAPR